MQSYLTPNTVVLKRLLEANSKLKVLCKGALLLLELLRGGALVSRERLASLCTPSSRP